MIKWLLTVDCMRWFQNWAHGRQFRTQITTNDRTDDFTTPGPSYHSYSFSRHPPPEMFTGSRGDEEVANTIQVIVPLLPSATNFTLLVPRANGVFDQSWIGLKVWLDECLFIYLSLLTLNCRLLYIDVRIANKYRRFLFLNDVVW